tara:strand:+ start:2028 stop:3881 length:1854 start_codon:yes stop_codon:yes gene_type:complete
MATPKFVIEVRTKGFAKLEDQFKRADQAAKGFDNTNGKLRGSTSGLRREIGALRNNILLYTFAVGAAARTMGTFIKSASDMQENMSKFKTVFGDASDDALNFAKSLSDSFQRSESEIIALMSSLQDTFVPLGFSRDAARKLSQALTQLSFDVGSFNNAASPEVAHAFTSAIVGNHEAVRRFGIVLTEAQLKQVALQTGIIDSARELTAQEKVLARVAIIFNSTADAQGDLIRTQDEFANRVRALQSEIEDLRVEIGEILIPVAELGLEFLKVERIKSYSVAIGGVAVAYGLARTAAFLFTASLASVRIALIKSGIGLGVVALGELGARFLMTKEDTNEGEKALLDYKTTLEDLSKLSTDTDTPGAVVKMVLQQKGAAIKADKDVMAEIRKREKERKELRDKRFQEQQERADFIKKLQERQHEAEMFRQDERREAILRAQAELKQLADEEAERIRKLSEPFKVLSQTLAQAILQTDNLGDAFKRTAQVIAAQVAAMVVEIAILQFLGVPQAGGGGGGLFSRLFVGHKGGSISNKGVQAFNTGGMVQGKDNVPILAQAGEYIIKRDSAQSIGLDTLNKINETGQAGSVNIHFNAPVTNADFIRDVVVPEIQKAVDGNLA